MAAQERASPFEANNGNWASVGTKYAGAVQHDLARRQAVAIPRLGIDEKAFLKGQNYFTIVHNLHRGIGTSPRDCKQADSDRFWTTLTPGHLQGIQAVAIDIWQAYFASISEHVAGAGKIVLGKFHHASDLGHAVNKVSRQENNSLRQEGDQRLVGTIVWPLEGAHSNYLQAMKPIQIALCPCRNLYGRFCEDKEERCGVDS